MKDTKVSENVLWDSEYYDGRATKNLPNITVDIPRWPWCPQMLPLARLADVQTPQAHYVHENNKTKF